MLDAAVGGPDACYFASLERRAVPGATRFGRETEGALAGVRVLESVAERDGDLLVSLRSSSRAASAAVTLLRDGRYVRSVSGPGPDAVHFASTRYTAGDRAVWVVEPALRTSVSEPRFTLRLQDVVDLTPGSHAFSASEAQRGLVLRVVAAARTVRHLHWTAADASVPMSVELTREDGTPYGRHQPCAGSGGCLGEHRHHVYSGAAATYFARVRAARATSVRFDVEALAVTEASVGEARTYIVGPSGRSYELPSVSRIEMLTFSSRVPLAGVYDRVEDGELGDPTWGRLGPSIRELDDFVARPTGQTLLVATARSGGLYTRTLLTERSYPMTTVVDPIAPGATYVYEVPVPRAPRSEGGMRLLVPAPAGQALRVRATHREAEWLSAALQTVPHFVHLVRRYTQEEWTGSGWQPAPPVQLEISGAPVGWRLMTIRAEFGRTFPVPPPSSLRVEIEAIPVVDGYAVTEVPLAASSICPSRGGAGSIVLDGSTVPTASLDGVPEVRLFGLGTGPLFVSRHGTLSRERPVVPEHLVTHSEWATTVSAFGEWLTDASEVCVLDDASALTLEWDGQTEAGVAVHAQVRVDRVSDVVELRYLPGHALRLPPVRTVGLVNRTGEIQVLHHQALPVGRALRFTPRSLP